MYNTSNMINEIYRIFTALNEHYFESSLPTPFITITQGKGKKNSFYGRFSPESWAKKESVEKVDVEELIQLANYESGRHESGSCGSVRAQLERLKDTYGFDYEIKLSYCGTEVDGISIVDEVD